MTLTLEKSRARAQANAVRYAVTDKAGKAVELIARWPAAQFRGASVAGYLPLSSEIDVRPLMLALGQAGQSIYLPAITRKAHPLEFRQYSAGDVLVSGPYGTREPAKTAKTGTPNVVLVPLLAFTASGMRLGYGGGYYDRTLAKLTSSGAVFACGVAFSAQEAQRLPSGPHDISLDGVLTEAGFREF